MKHNQPNNWIRKLLFAFGVALFHFGLAHVIISLSSRRVRALLYHSIDSQTNDWTEGLGVNVTPAEFAANLAYFNKYYNVVDVMDVAAQPALKRPLVITFDDGYKNILTHAAPVLQQYNMPATVYLISRATNGELVWVNLLNRALRHAPEKTRKLLRRWPELSSDHSNQAIIRTVQEHFTPTAIEALCTEIRNAFSAATLAPETDLYLNRDDIHSLTQQNIRFGFHTRDHYNMGICTHNEVISQLNTNDIADLLNSRSFAYPFGYFNACTINCVAADNYERIMTVGNNNQRFNELHLDRIEVFTANPAHVFSHIEVVEPVIAFVRRMVLTVKGRYNTRAPASTANTSTARTR